MEEYIPKPGDIIDGDILGEDNIWREAPKGYIMEGPATPQGQEKPLQPIDIVHESEEYGNLNRKGSKMPLYLILGVIGVVVVGLVAFLIISVTSLGSNMEDAGKSHTGVTEVVNAASTLSVAMVNGNVPLGVYTAGQEISFPDSSGATTVVTVPNNGKITINTQGFIVCGGDAGDLYQVNDDETTPQHVKNC